jgi:hypothetical protein
MKLHKKHTSLDPGLINLKENVTISAKKENWTVVFKELAVSALEFIW